MKKVLATLLMITALSFTVSAQKDYKKEADVAFGGYKYYTAIELYKKAYTKETKSDEKSEILFQIGECYRLKNDGKQAAVWYDKAIKAKHDSPLAHLYLADIYKTEKKYEDAIVEYEKFKALAPGDKRADIGIKSCESSKKWDDEPTRIVVTPMPQINSEDYDFSPIFSDKKGEELYFTSTRQGATGTAISDVTGMNFSDIYSTSRDKKGKWSEPTLLNSTINSEVEEGAAVLNEKKNTMYFTRCGVEKKGVIGCSIYQSKKTGKNWGEPELIPIASDTFAIMHPAISNDENTIVFSSDISGGKGGQDLWYITYDKKAKTWSEPVNLGAEINTTGNEMFPFIRDNGELYFASNGHPGMGGLDLFKAQSKGVNQWSKVENLKSPLNSSADDFGIVFEENKERGFFTTSREGGKGGDDIWEFYLPPLMFALNGTVNDLVTTNPIANATIKLIGTDGSSAETTTDESGNFTFAENGSDRYLNPNTSYSLIVTKNGYLIAKGKETTVGLKSSKTFNHEYNLQPVINTVIKLPLIEYEFAKWNLLPNSKDSLNFLYNVMVENPTLIVQLRSHTDFRGSNKNNMVLSQKRAQSCVDYLVKEKGIDPARLVAKGMGEEEPLKMADGTLLDEKYITSLKDKPSIEEAHQRNRRTDFKVLSTDFVPKNTTPEVAPSN